MKQTGETMEGHEIVGVKYNNTFYFGLKAVSLISEGKYEEFLLKKHMQLMAMADLGINWERAAKARTIFKVVNGKPEFVEGGLLVPKGTGEPFGTRGW